jgi:aspartyl-tRNA(Asn)/glutamyl-tRNA(Gln) amidotransferase subunit B
MKESDIQHRVIVGFEIHVQLATKTKLFCGCAVEFGAEPNSRTCPVCLGLPGALPVMNRTAVDFAIQTGLALNCEIVRHAKWDRKGYYYPDLPKNYQISQYDLPIAQQGHFDIETDDGPKRVRIIRAHLEEDAGKNVHDAGDFSLVDLNRTGTPLLEIVTEPEIESAQQAYTFCTELQKLVAYLGISQAVMQKGQMRFEPNVNVAIIAGGQEFRTPISEIKNLNSFRAVRKAIEYEHRRQVQDWLADPDYLFNKRPNENRGWDDDHEATIFQRSKEAAQDYRYFPEPDLVPLEVTDTALEDIKAKLPERPAKRIARLVADHGLTNEAAGIIVSDRATADLFDQALATNGSPATLANHFVNIWTVAANQAETVVGRLGIDARRLAELADLVDKGTITATGAKQIAARMIDTDESPNSLADSMGLIVVQDEGQLRAWVDEALVANESAVRDALDSPKKTQKAIGFLRGQVMRISAGKANPKQSGQLIEAKLAELAGKNQQ